MMIYGREVGRLQVSFLVELVKLIILMMLFNSCSNEEMNNRIRSLLPPSSRITEHDKYKLKLSKYSVKLFI